MRAISKLGLLVMLAVAAYFGFYVALVQRGLGLTMGGSTSWRPTYRVSGQWPCRLVGTIFEPAHILDRRFFRTKMWGEQLDFLPFYAVELGEQRLHTNSVAPNQHLQATPR